MRLPSRRRLSSISLPGAVVAVMGGLLAACGTDSAPAPETAAAPPSVVIEPIRRLSQDRSQAFALALAESLQGRGFAATADPSASGRFRITGWFVDRGDVGGGKQRDCRLSWRVQEGGNGEPGPLLKQAFTSDHTCAGSLIGPQRGTIAAEAAALLAQRMDPAMAAAEAAMAEPAGTEAGAMGGNGFTLDFGAAPPADATGPTPMSDDMDAATIATRAAETLKATRPAPEPTMAKPMPAKPMPAKPMMAAKPVAPKPMMASETSNAAAGPGPWVQLASLRKATVAEREAQRLARKYADLLESVGLRVVSRDFGGAKGAYYRVRSGSLKDMAAAKKLCQALQARKQSCWVIRGK